MPFEAAVGAAAFRRGPMALVVFDVPRPLDLAAVPKDNSLGSGIVRVLPAATVLSFPLPAGKRLALSRVPAGWRVEVATPAQDPQQITPAFAGGRLSLPVGQPGHVVAVPDPNSAATLFVGTQRQPGEAVVTERETPEFALLPTWQGVAVEPLSDLLQLSPAPNGFRLGGLGTSLALSAGFPFSEPLANAAVLTRQFDFPASPISALRQLLRQQIAAAAAAPPLGRAAQRRAAAQTMLALGLGMEAWGALAAAGADDPAEAEAPDHLGLAGVAAVLADRPDLAAGLLDPRLSGTDEVALWRALRQATLQPGAPEAAAALAATAPLLLTYPPALGSRMLPLAIETMIAGGQAKAAAPLLDARADDARLALARGMAAEANHQTDQALAIYDDLSVGKDRLLRIRAALRAIDIRVASGRLTPGQAADALDKLTNAWRGDAIELALRQRLAGLRAETGAWRPAFALLRQTLTEFPESAETVRTQMRVLFTKFLGENGSTSLSPFEFVALISDNADLLPGGLAGEVLEARLADRLLALDLPRQAGATLEKLMRAAPSDAGRAGFGARLAALRLGESDAAGALAALAASDASGLDPALAERRALLFAEASARKGDMATAIAALEPFDTPPAMEKRAAILEQAGDWPGAERAMQALAAKAVPDAATLDDAARRMLLRLATDAARAGDAAGLDSLREHDAERLGPGPLGDMFRLLTAAPVDKVADLGRAAKETSLAGGLASDLQAVSAPAKPR